MEKRIRELMGVENIEVDQREQVLTDVTLVDSDSQVILIGQIKFSFSYRLPVCVFIIV